MSNVDLSALRIDESSAAVPKRPLGPRLLVVGVIALTLAVAIFAYAGYNYLVGRVNSIVLDMEKSSAEIQNLVSDIAPDNNPA